MYGTTYELLIDILFSGKSGSWDSWVYRILFETELQFSEKSKKEKMFFSFGFRNFRQKRVFSLLTVFSLWHVT